MYEEEEDYSKNNKYVLTLLLVTCSYIFTPFRIFKSSKVVKSSKAKNEEEEED